MKYKFLALFMIAMMGLTAIASANRHYFLVGIRHVYKMPVYPDPHELDRQAIEETYAAAIQAAQNQYDQDMNSIAADEAADGGQIHQNDRDAVQLNIEQDTAVAADQRDASLSLIYPQDDQARVKHPELQVDQDGPYQVMAIDTSPAHVFVDVCYFRPYPMYVDVCPFGWAWGRYYPWGSFTIAFRSWHAHWISIGSPVFGGLCFGRRHVEVYMPLRRGVIVSRTKWVNGRPPAITDKERENFVRRRDLQVKNGVIHVPAHTGANRPTSKYSRVGTRVPIGKAPPSTGRGPIGGNSGGNAGNRNRGGQRGGSNQGGNRNNGGSRNQGGNRGGGNNRGGDNRGGGHNRGGQ